MISVLDVAVALGFAALAWYWVDALRAKEIARAAGLRACQQAEAQFLDDTVELTKLALRRDSHGQLALYREYRFEFTHDGSYRQRGQMAMLGRRVLQLTLMS